MGLLSRAKTVRSSESISFDERAEIQAQIDALFTEQQSAFTTSTSDYKDAKRGALLPLLVNVFGIAVIVAGTVFLFLRFNQAETSITTPAAAAISTEAAIVSSVRETAQQQIAEREAEIARIRAQLQDLRDTDSGGGVDAATTDEIAALETQLTELLEAQTAAQTLTDAGTEVEQTAFLSRQLQAVYADTEAALEQEDVDRALARLEDADRIVAEFGEQGGFSSQIATVARASNGTIRAAARSITPDGGGQQPDTSPLTVVASLVEQANARFDAGDRGGAERLYRAAIEEIDAVDVAYQRLEELSGSDADDTNASLRQRIQALDNQLRNARETIAELETTTEERQVRVAAERRIIEEQLEEILQELEDTNPGARTSSGQAGQVEEEPEVIDLLESKLALREVLESPLIESDYPAAEEDFEAYVQDLGRERYLTGWRNATREAIDGIDALLRSLGTSPDSAAVEELSPAESLQLLFRRLDTLLRQVISDGGEA